MIERGHLARASLETLRSAAAVLDVRLDLVARWRGGELDRRLNARHSALHESVARYFATLPAWVFEPEVSFSIYGERGVIDILAWHPQTRSLVVIELKTLIVDVQALVGDVDGKRRLAARIARERGWDVATVSSWVIVVRTKTNQRRIAAHHAMLEAAFPQDGRDMRSWLRRPERPVRGLSMWTDVDPSDIGRTRGSSRVTVRVPRRV